MANNNKYYLLRFVVIKYLLKGISLFAGMIAVILISSCEKISTPDSPLSSEVSPVDKREIVIYSPAPKGIMLHGHNVELGEALNACGISRTVRVVPMALPESINFINTLDPLEKPYHLPIVETLDFIPAIQGNAPEWHSYDVKNPDLRFVTSLYDVAFGLLSFDVSIQSPADLVGKRIGVPARPSAVRWFTEALLRDGWGVLDQVSLVDIVPPHVPSAIADGKIDVVAWNIMSETPVGYQPLLPMILKREDVHWLDVDTKTLAAINAANPFKTERTTVGLDNIIGVEGVAGESVNLLSFRQALAAWSSTPDSLIREIVTCMSNSDVAFGSGAAQTEKQFDWPYLAKENIHPGAFTADDID